MTVTSAFFTTPIGVAVMAAARLLSDTSETARLDAEVLLADALGTRRIDLYADWDTPVSDVAAIRFSRMVSRRQLGEPVAYIRGKKDFWRQQFKVSSATLIPRPETELLVELGVRSETMAGLDQPLVLDLGTGSGCIALSLARELPQAQIIGWELSRSALAVACENRQQVGSQNVCFELRDMLLEDNWYGCRERGHIFDIIVGNLPYVPEGDKLKLATDVVEFEPHRALFGGIDGLSYFRRVSQLASLAARPGTMMHLEVGMGQATAVSEIMRSAGWRDVFTTRDLSGIERVVSGKWG